MITDVNRLLPIIHIDSVQSMHSPADTNISAIEDKKGEDVFVKTDENFEKPPVEIGTWEVDSETGYKYLNVEIFDETYKFKQNDFFNIKRLKKMIKNIEDSYTGFFVKRNRHEEVIPNRFNGIPDIIEDNLLIRHGNAKTVPNLETRLAAERLNRFLDMDIDIDDLKTINYMVKTEEGYANNDERVAYSAYDDKEDTLYLYIPDEGVLKKLYDNGFVKNFEIY